MSKPSIIKTQDKSEKSEKIIEAKPNINFQIISAQFKESCLEEGRKIDPYVKIKIGVTEFRTQVALNQGLTPVWNYVNKLHLVDLNSIVNVELWEWDKQSSDKQSSDKQSSDKQSSEDCPGTAKIVLLTALGHEGKEFTLEVLKKGTSIGYVVLKVIEIKKQQLWSDNTQVEALQNYLKQNNLSKSCQIIFAEILTQDIPKQHVFAYTALRLRQIGSDLEQIMKSQQQSQKESKILDQINE